MLYEIDEPSQTVLLGVNKYLKKKKTTNLNQNLANHYKLEKLKHNVQDAFPHNGAKNLLQLK